MNQPEISNLARGKIPSEALKLLQQVYRDETVVLLGFQTAQEVQRGTQGYG